MAAEGEMEALILLGLWAGLRRGWKDGDDMDRRPAPTDRKE